jgi:signal transduction histidine kinase
MVSYFVFDDKVSYIFLETSKYVAFSSHSVLSISFLYREVCDWRRSKLSYQDWYAKREFESQNTLTIYFCMFASVICLVIFAVALNPAAGIKNITFPSLAVIVVVPCITSVFVTLLPQRLAKVKAIKLEGDLALKKTFVRYISHELRTPLSIAVTGLELLEDRIKEGATTDELLAIIKDIKQPCMTGVTVLNDLLDFEKLDSGLTVLDASEQDPCVFFESTVLPFRLVAQQKHIELSISNTVAVGSIVVCMDSPKMSQVLRNLLSNALKFTPVEGSVTVTASVEAGYYTVKVKDSGVGVSAEKHLSLFDEAFQFHANAQGSGLGLWISKKIVEMHGGSIGVSSEGEGLGSTFYFKMPIKIEKRHLRRSIAEFVGDRLMSSIARVEPEPEPVQNETAPVAVLQTRVKSIRLPADMRVLIVDDSALNRKMMAKRLEKLNCILLEVDDGDVAVERVQASLRGEIAPFDIITMDNVSLTNK